MDSSAIVKKPILYYDEINPQARSVLVLIDMINADVELRPIDTFLGENFSLGYVEINPAHTVPAMVHYDLKLTDSRAILMYIAMTCGGKYMQQLFPRCMPKRFKVINKLFFESTVLFRRHSELMTEIIRKTFANIDFTFHQQKILGAYEILERFLKDSCYMACDELTIADISISSTVCALNMLFPIHEQRMTMPRLYGWFSRMSAMPAFQRNNKGLERERCIIESVGKMHFPASRCQFGMIPDPIFEEQMKNNGLIEIEEEANEQIMASAVTPENKDNEPTRKNRKKSKTEEGEKEAKDNKGKKKDAKKRKETGKETAKKIKGKKTTNDETPDNAPMDDVSKTNVENVAPKIRGCLSKPSSSCGCDGETPCCSSQLCDCSGSRVVGIFPTSPQVYCGCNSASVNQITRDDINATYSKLTCNNSCGTCNRIKSGNDETQMQMLQINNEMELPKNDSNYPLDLPNQERKKRTLNEKLSSALAEKNSKKSNNARKRKVKSQKQ